ncbi:MAG: 4-hydroxybenzoate octaprenyltransferase [Sinobacterium sp.]|nr:4-hydroxybenzoate octaprenyltransferase [Sinobacterium sp.]
MTFLGLKSNNLKAYAQLMRLDRPIGTLLVLWPTLCGLWLAAGGVPSMKNLIIFSLGAFLMRSAGCVINDFADREIDGQVKRTQTRPMATGKVTEQEALVLFVLISGCAFILVLFTNWLTIGLSVIGALLAACYPFMKRYTYFPQVILGAAFSWSIIMAYAAETNDIPKDAWLLYVAVLVWTVVYDTFYAMIDRDDDIKIGVKSTAILFGDYDKVITSLLQFFTVFVFFLVGYQYELGLIFFSSTIVIACLFSYQQYIIFDRDRDACFKAFLNNNWVGLTLFLGIALDFAVK